MIGDPRRERTIRLGDLAELIDQDRHKPVGTA
jgi:hypothetical protein